MVEFNSPWNRKQQVAVVFPLSQTKTISTTKELENVLILDFLYVEGSTK